MALKDGRKVYLAWFAESGHAGGHAGFHRLSVEFASFHPKRLARAAGEEPRTREELLAFLRQDDLGDRPPKTRTRK